MDYWLKIAHWVYDMQALIAGIFASLAAGITVIVLRKQIEQSDKHHKELINRKHRAVRAGMPIALVSINQYAIECIRYLSNMESAYLNKSDFAASLIIGDDTIPIYPKDAFEEIQKVIEFSDENIVKKLIDFIGFSQVQSSRFDSFVSENIDYNQFVKRVNLCHSHFYRHYLDAYKTHA